MIYNTGGSPIIMPSSLEYVAKAQLTPAAAALAPQGCPACPAAPSCPPPAAAPECPTPAEAPFPWVWIAVAALGGWAFGRPTAGERRLMAAVKRGDSWR